MISLPNKFLNQTNPNEPKKRIALILKGGGVKGLALVGSILELSKYYKFDAYVGTSAGAIVAGLLAAGCSEAELEKILRRTKFRQFQDGKWYLSVWNLVFNKFLHPGKAFDIWLGDEIKSIYNVSTNQYSPPTLKDLNKSTRLTIYAAQNNVGVVEFDSLPETEESSTPLALAIRYSMSIPFFFKPLIHKGQPIFDGGMFLNFPAKEWSEKNPEYDFIGIYLGDKFVNPNSTGGILTNLIQTIVDRDDSKFIDDNNRDKVIIVDPKPIDTTDFDLSDEEANYLVLQGRADTLEHLFRYIPTEFYPNLPEDLRPNDESLDAIKQEAANAKLIAESVRKKRKENRFLLRLLTASVLILLTAYTLWIGLPPLFKWWLFGREEARKLEAIYQKANATPRDSVQSIKSAITDFKKLIDVDYKPVSVYDNQAEAYQQLAEIYGKSSNTSECEINLEAADKAWGEAIDILSKDAEMLDDPRSDLPSLYLHRADVRQERGHLRKAFEDYERACINDKPSTACQDEKTDFEQINFRAAEPRGIRRKDSVDLNLLLRLDF